MLTGLTSRSGTVVVMPLGGARSSSKTSLSSSTYLSMTRVSWSATPKLRSLCASPQLLPDEKFRQDNIKTCKEIIRIRCDDRPEDPGQVVYFGYTCGSRHRPEMKLAANCIKQSPQEFSNFNNECQGMAGIGWNMLRGRLPQSIIDDYNDTIQRFGCPRIDIMKDDNTTFAYNVGGKDMNFNNDGHLELPPPSGLSAINYASFTHQEVNGNNWFIAVTCSAAKDASIGGIFNNASYGILMKAANNTVSVSQPHDYHGTTLYEMIPHRTGRYKCELRPDGREKIGFVVEVSQKLSHATKNGKTMKQKLATIRQPGSRKRKVRWESDAEGDTDSNYVP
jgi:hypothetical protein